MRSGSISLARSLCYEIEGPIDENDSDGSGYSSVDIAEILSAEVVRLRDQRDELSAAIKEMVAVLEGV